MIASSCIALASGAALFVLPTSEVTLQWHHSVERTAWEEDYVAAGEGLAIREARIKAIGAGMEPPASAVREGEWWRYRPSLPALPSVAFANSSFVGGYSICWSGGCRPLNIFVAPDTAFTLQTDDCVGSVAPGMTGMLP